MSSVISNNPQQDVELRARIDRSLRHPIMFFLTCGVAWLIVSVLLGLCASIKLHHPAFLNHFGFLTYGRVFPAHMCALIYGWGMQAAFAMILWLMARLTRKTYTMKGAVLTAAHIWNLTILIGIVSILSGSGTGIPWMEFPTFIWPVLLVAYVTIIIGSFIQFRVKDLGHTYITQWYLIAAMVWFPWVFITANTLIHCLKGHPIMAAGINAWFHSAFIFLFFVPVGLGVSYYLAPKVTGRPIVSYSLSKFGFWALAIIAPWAGFQKLAGAPIPYFIPYVGAAAAILLFIPLCAAAVNILTTIASNADLSVQSPTLRFAAAGGIGFVVLACAGLLLNLPGSTLQLTQFTISNYGFDLLAIYGFFTLTMFAGIYFIVPRITCTEWISAKAIQLHFLLSVYGVLSISIVTLFGGLMQGSAQEDFKVAWTSAADYSKPYSVAVSVAWCLILVSNITFFIHLVKMWLNYGLNQPNPTLIEISHSSPPHGSDGDIDNAGPGHVSTH